MASQASFSDLTTLRLGGPAAAVVTAETEADLIEAAGQEAGEDILVVGGGSNLVVSDDGFSGTAVLVRTKGVEVEADTCGGAFVTVQAGEEWDEVVARAVAEGWIGIEALSGIPGSVGATPIQNVGAYGQEVAETIARVRVFDRLLGSPRTFTLDQLRFGYRTSRFKAEPGRHVVLSVSFQLKLGDLGTPVKYGELARSLGIEVGQRAPLADVRDAVLALRSSKGMVLDPADHDTWSAGSFFTNPFVDANGAVSDGAPAYPQPDGRVKTSAAWLIEHAGFGKGYVSAAAGPGVALSTKHTLALTNRGEGTTAALLTLAEEIRQGVLARFGILLEPEPTLVGVSL